MNAEFPDSVRRRMARRGISEEDVLECLTNYVDYYHDRGDITYRFHDRQERMIKVRTRGTQPLTIVDAIRLA